jgi:uncharacterized protein
MSAEPIAYLDSSALVKLIVREAESEALLAYLQTRPTRASCALARVEVIRAVRPHGRAAVTRARQLLERILLLRLDDSLLEDAATLGGTDLRSLDALHLSAARVLGDGLTELVTYDRRMAAAAEDAGLPVLAPA